MPVAHRCALDRDALADALFEIERQCALGRTDDLHPPLPFAVS